MRNYFYLSKSYPNRAIEFNWYVEDLYTKKHSVVSSLNIEEVEEGSITRPVEYIKYDEAQQLMDELWNCGIRPTEGAGTAGSMAATQKHLEDMRTIVFEHYLKQHAD